MTIWLRFCNQCLNLRRNHIFTRSSNFLSYGKWLFSDVITTTTKMKIFTDVGNIFSLRVLASCYATNTELIWQIVDGKHVKAPGFTGKLPVVEVKTGRYLFNCNAATCYVFNQSDQTSSFSGNNKQKIDELVEWDSQKLQPSIFPLLTTHILSTKHGVVSCDSSKGVLSTLDSLLDNKEYLLGSSLSAADVVIWGTLYGFMQIEYIKELISKYPSLLKWFSYISSKEPFVKAVEKVTAGNGISAFKSSLEAYSVPSCCRKYKYQYNAAVAEEFPKSVHEESDEITQQQIDHAKEEWSKGRNKLMKPNKIEHPILPKKGERNILITSALPYVNNVPHLGNIIGCVLSADVYSRFCRLRNYNSLFICGTDEYGTATETKALAEGVTPQQICDKYYCIHRDIYKWFNIDFDYFGRTSTEQQTKIAQDIFWRIHKNGYFLEDNVDQLKCIPCNRVLADRFVEGTCPFCKYEDARGDQCDACGKLINAIELINPKCKECNASPVIQTSRHVFLDLPKVEPQLRDWIQKSVEGNWTHNAKNITKAWLAEGLKPRCITRDLNWGTPVPLEGFTDKVFYVWFDAPIGYLSITHNYTDEWEKWWKNPDEVELVQFMAKDNVPFHTVVFPASLIASQDNYTLLSVISATEYLNYEDTKFSKSRGVGVFGDHAESTGIPADIYRFYLLFVRPESQDSSFQWADFVLKNNSELLNNLGNFVNRALMFLKNSFDSTMPKLDLTEEEYKVIASVNKDLASYVELLDKLKLRDGLRVVLNISRSGNQYIQNCQPWVLAKGTDEERARAGTIIGLAVNISGLISILLKPYMPNISLQLQEQMALPDDYFVIPEYFVPLLSTGHKIGVPYPLFKKIEAGVEIELKKKFAGTRVNKIPKNSNGESKATKEEPSAEVKPDIDPVKIAELEALVAQQGDVVRKAKMENSSKDVIDAEVKKLLELKNSLAISQGIDPNEAKKGKTKNKKNSKKKQ